MLKALRDIVIARVQQRVAEADFPTIPAETVETLEQVICDLVSATPATDEAVALAHITLEDDGPYIDLEVLNGSTLQPDHSPVPLYTRPAPGNPAATNAGQVEASGIEGGAS